MHMAILKVESCVRHEGNRRLAGGLRLCPRELAPLIVPLPLPCCSDRGAGSIKQLASGHTNAQVRVLTVPECKP